jgi:long-chain acyl-CoA synthetase
MVRQRGTEHPAEVAFRQRQGDAFVDIDWKTCMERMDRIGAGLLTAFDIEHNAAVAIIGNTSLEWVLCDFAAQMIGLRTVPIYASLLPEEVGYMHVDTDVVLSIAENADQVHKIREMRKGFTFFDNDYGADRVRLQHIVVIDPTGLEAADDWESLADLEARGAEQLEATKAQREERASKVSRDMTATYTYTSGTTGAPKAVIQTHDNMLAMLESIESLQMFNDQVMRGGLFLFLPLAHSFGRLIELAGPFFGSPIVLSSVPTLVEDLGLAKPGFFPSAPRVYEKMKSKIETAVAGAPPARQKLFRWAVDTGKATIPYRSKGEPLPFLLGLKLRIADKIVLSKLRARLGLDSAGLLLSGSAPLSVEVHEFFLAMQLDLMEAYGLTETCPGLTTNMPGDFRLGTVGKPFPGVQIRIAPDNEILAKGPNITSGYLNRDDATSGAFDDEGWFCTGDLGSMDPEGFVKITGRKKELIKTSGGKYVAPAMIEGRMKTLPIIQEAVVVGDTRNYCVALVSIDPEELTEWAQQQGVPAESDSEAVRKAVQEHLDGVNANLASYSTIKYFRILPEPMTVENGILTASLKVKRKVVEERYAALIDEMYSSAAAK